ncbi:MAG TPA: tRNA pseudouridine(38-40) synthase TruA [Acidimicrobiales bacterium]|nr:tRNA pseudouridine(38-40) synthase TruA [Acidimicrobiales bacterium]
MSEAAPQLAPQPVRVVLHCSYDGSGFHGFATQRGQRTVQGALEAALEQITGAAAETGCAGRTDTGVHAVAQVVHADVDPAYLERLGLAAEPFAEVVPLSRSLSKILAPDVVTRRAFVAPEGFDARRSATARRYRYVIDCGDRRDPLYRAASWHLPGELDLAAMRVAADALCGEHDFSAFCRQPKGREPGPLRRRVIGTRFTRDDALVCFEIEANAFCHQMVRSIVGMLVAVGRGRRTAAEVAARLRAPDRGGLPSPAPAIGLCLIAVEYPEHLGGAVR